MADHGEIGTNFPQNQSGGEFAWAAKIAQQEYMHSPALDRTSTAYLELLADRIGQRPKQYYQFVAGWVCAEIALLSRAFNSEAREALIDQAVDCWQGAVDNPRSQDIAGRALLAICQRQTLSIVSEAANEGYFHPLLAERQEADYRRFFSYYLENWDKWDSHGFAYEALSSYSAHRSNRLRPNEPPLLALSSSVREDHHISPGRRIDVACYETYFGDRFGLQIKSGRIVDSDVKQSRLRRILLGDARNLLRIPRTSRKLWNTMSAIVDEDPEFELDLDVIAVDHRVRLQEYFANRKRAMGRVPLRHLSRPAPNNR